MLIKYSDELDNQEFAEIASALRALKITMPEIIDDDKIVPLGSINNPAVALDRHALFKLQNGRLISHLFAESERPVITTYDGTFNGWYKFPNTWPAAIDTLVHLRGQRNSTALHHAEIVLDLGCGTGMAGFYAVSKNPQIAHVHFSDIEVNCVKSAGANERFLQRKVHLSGSVGDTFGNVEGKYDVIIASAVPATPPFPQLARPLNTLFEGTVFLERLLEGAPEHLIEGGKLILSHSKLGEREFREAAKKYGAKVDKVLYERPVAFRTEFLGDERWVEFLVRERGMERREDGDWTYWHTPIVKEISYR
jgi:SAM-dependent methyltransferase